LCFSFISPGGRELREERERERERERKKVADQLGLSDPVPGQQIVRLAGSSCLTLLWAVMYLKKLV
jgi:hypothetical protein